MNSALQEYLDDFNDGNIDDLLEIFDSMGNLLLFFKKQKMLQYINPFDDNLEDYQNEILYYLITNLGDEKILHQCINQFRDVVFENNEYYLKITDKKDLSDLFDDTGRDLTARDIVKSIFGEDNWEHFSNTTDDIYQDVVEVLTPENVERLKQHILDVLTNWKIEVDDETPDLFNNYSKDGIFYLTPENVNTVIGDEESFMYLLDNDYLPNITGDLYSIHYNSYNSAYETEIYDDVMGELETFFDAKTAKWESIPSRYNPEKLIEHYVLKFNPNELKNSIMKYLSDRNLWGWHSHTFDSQGDWLTMMNTLMDNGDESWLDFRTPDYADWTLTKRYINEMFPDYI